MTKDNLTKLVLTLLTASLFGGWSWIRDIETRIAILEDDLDETVTVIGVLHPPSPIRPAVFAAAEFLELAAPGKCGPRCESRRKKLRKLKPQEKIKDVKPSPDAEPEESPDANEDPGVDVPGC